MSSDHTDEPVPGLGSDGKYRFDLPREWTDGREVERYAKTMTKDLGGDEVLSANGMFLTGGRSIHILTWPTGHHAVCFDYETKEVVGRDTSGEVPAPAVQEGIDALEMSLEGFAHIHKTMFKSLWN